MAHGYEWPEGNAYHSGTGKVLHDGDFIEFSLNFEASCYDTRTAALNQVVNNVATFTDWLNSEKANYESEAITHEADPINVWRKGNNHYDNECAGKYFASQSLVLTLNKANEASALHADLIQDFYQELQLVVWPLNLANNEPEQARISTTISDVQKGVYESTADDLRIAAKAKARNKATNDFLAFLGPDYQGTWWLHSADFREQSYSGLLKTSVERYADSAVAPLLPGSGEPPIPASLKLKPLSLSVTGNFHFIYTY